MSPWFEAAFAKYAWIWVGLSFGLLAKYALLIKRGVQIKVRHIAADVLLLPTVALIAYTFAAKVGLTGEPAALATAFCTVGADRLVKLLTDRFISRVDSEARSIADDLMGQARQTVQAELSGNEIIKDNLTGTAPSEYKAIKPRRLPRKGRGE